MKNRLVPFLTLVVLMSFFACQSGDGNQAAEQATDQAASTSQPEPTPASTENNIVNVAVGSPDHTTLVAAVKAADLVDDLTNVGPFTVFAPTNAAFEKLPAGTVEGLLKPEKKSDLRNILKYHVTTSALSDVMLSDGMTLGMANGGKATIKREGDKISINGANVLGSVKATNGMVYVIDSVLLPK
jgi:uncharacterized surface protein with fasciclin (FAS1) repeats